MSLTPDSLAHCRLDVPSHARDSAQADTSMEASSQDAFKFFGIESLPTYTASSKLEVLVFLIVWAGAKQSRSPGAEQPTQVRVYQLPVGVDGLASLTYCQHIVTCQYTSRQLTVSKKLLLGPGCQACLPPARCRWIVGRERFLWVNSAPTACQQGTNQ